MLQGNARLTCDNSWAPILDEDPSVCGLPQKYDASKEWKGKKVVLVSLPGEFSIPIDKAMMGTILMIASLQAPSLLPAPPITCLPSLRDGLS